MILKTFFQVGEKWFCKLGFFFWLEKSGSRNSDFFFWFEKSGWPEKIRVCRTTEKWLQIKLMIVYFIQDVVALFHVWFKLTNNSKRLMNTLSSTLSNFENQIMLKHVFYLNFDRGHSLLYLRRNKVHKNNNHTGSFIRESIIFHFANFWLNCCLWNWRHWHKYRRSVFLDKIEFTVRYSRQITALILSKYIPCIPTKLSLGEGPSLVDHDKSNRKVNQNIPEFRLKTINLCIRRGAHALKASTYDVKGPKP